jgi:CBS domain-containing protein
MTAVGRCSSPELLMLVNHEVVTVAPDCPLEDAASLLVGHKIGSLPVMEEGQVVGIITEVGRREGRPSLRMT